METTKSLIQLNLTVLQKQLNVPIVYDKTSDKIFIVKKVNDNLLYYEIGESEQIYFDLSPENLIFPLSLELPAYTTATNTNKQTANSIQTENKQTPNTKTNIFPTRKNIVSTEKERPTITPPNTKGTAKLSSRKRQKTAEYYNIADFSELYDKGIIKQTAKDIFLITTEILSNTKTQNVIDETLKLYEKARKHAKSGQPTDINELRKILKQLQTKRNRQKGINKGKSIYTEKQQKRLKIKILIAIVIFSTFIIYQISRTHRTTQNTNENQKIAITKDLIISTIKEFEKQNNIKVYQWRQTKIIESLTGAELTPEQFNDTLNYYIFKAWK